MQDNIPEALIAAFEHHYDFPWDEPTLRNERLAWRAAWAEATKPCLPQIQEPAAAEQVAWHAGLDEGRAQAAPAAVAVPDAVRDAEKLLRAEAARLDRLYGMNKWYGFCAEKASRLEHLRVADALAATPAAAAQVVLPEPQHWVLETQALDKEFDYTGVQKKAEHWKAIGLNPTALFTEQQLRAALLAGVSAPAAQAEPVAWLYTHKLGGVQTFTTEPPPGLKAQCQPLYTAPQAQADTRDAQLLAFAVSEIRRDEFAAPQAQADAQDAQITWPKARDVGRIGDMSPSAHMRVGFDSDNDVLVSVWDERGGGCIEFCNPGGGGGGQSSRTRMALIALMVAMEADNAEKPSRDWWAQRAAQAAQQGGDKQ